MNWRRERDSNPRYGDKPYTHFPGVLLQPLGHLSVRVMAARFRQAQSTQPRSLPQWRRTDKMTWQAWRRSGRLVTIGNRPKVFVMSYQVLARKWRPRQFSELVGQEHVVRALSNALDADRTHHAYLFAGTRGIGKTTIARIFAKSINCEKGQSAEPCGVCAVCTAVDAGRFIDLLEIDAASNTGVDDVRELIENAQYAPTSGRYKVYLIDEVHMLSKSAFNALLKTLEEPPPHVKFLLATTDPDKLPMTVRSRCLKFNLKRLLPQQISGQLTHILEAEGIDFDGQAVEDLARAADGSMRDGLSLLDQSLAYGGGALHADETRAMLGTVEQGNVTALLEALADGDGEALLTGADEIAQHAPDFASVLDQLAQSLHQMQLRQLVPAHRTESVRDSARIDALADRLSAEEVQLYYQIAGRGRRELGYAPDAQSGFEMLLLRMLAFRPADAGAGLSTTRGNVTTKSSTARTERSTPVTTPQTPVKPPAKPAATPTPTVPVARHPGPASAADWHDLIARAKPGGPTGQLARNALLDSVDGNVWTLAVKPQHMSLAVEPMIGRLQTLLGEQAGQQIRLRFVTRDALDETPADRAETASQTRQSEAEQALRSDPLLQQLEQELGAKIIPQTIKPLGGAN